MAVIVIQDLVDDAVEWLPPENTLDNDQLTAMAEDVVAFRIPEDDDIYYSQALCILLKNAAVRNKALASSSSNLKRDKTGDVEYEWDVQNREDPWDSYLNTLPDVCPILPGGGFNIPLPAGIKISPGVVPTGTKCKEKEDEVYF